VGLVQMRCTDDARENQAAAEDGIRAAAKRGAQIVCLPELYRSLYFCQSEDHANFALAEAIPGPSTKALGALAKKLKIAIVGSLFERRAAGVYHNTAVVIDADGRHVGTYRKMHIPDDPLYYEKFYFTPGDLGFQAFDTKHGRIGTLVCWDQWYPEAARLTALRGPTVLFYPTAIGWHPSEKKQWGESQVSAWQTIQRSHAIANGIYVAAVNRTGHEGAKDAGIEFFGGLVHLRSVRTDHRRSVAEQAGGARRGGRPAGRRDRAPALAVPARPADRRLRIHHRRSLEKR
jgi:N-carbamoylputrescine amidase